LFYLVFGESVINDAVGLVLFEALRIWWRSNPRQQINAGTEVLQFVFDFSAGFFGSSCWEPSLDWLSPCF
jgi:NhaP-type Na+/H+ or K+/H+ antiporter